MSNLKKELDDQMTIIFNKNGAFFAFSNEQFNAAKKDGVAYAALQHGLICPKENVNDLYTELDSVVADFRKKDIEQNGIDNIIKRELSNHEAYYTGEIEATAEALKGYEVTNEQIWAVYRREYANQDL